MTQFKARDSGIDYEREFGLNLDLLGCVMLDVDLIPGYVEKYTDSIGLEPYVSDDPEQFWINGITDPDKLHVTLRYGLLPTVRRRHAESIFFRIQRPLSIEYQTVACKLNTFPGFNGEYFVLVLELTRPILRDADESIPNLHQWIVEAHYALGVLPNVATFSPPTFHITLGYFKGEAPQFADTEIYPAMRPRMVRYGKHMRP